MRNERGYSEKFLQRPYYAQFLAEARSRHGELWVQYRVTAGVRETYEVCAFDARGDVKTFSAMSREFADYLLAAECNLDYLQSMIVEFHRRYKDRPEDLARFGV